MSFSYLDLEAKYAANLSFRHPLLKVIPSG
jgi:hypothetical protein